MYNNTGGQITKDLVEIKNMTNLHYGRRLNTLGNIVIWDVD